MAEYGSIIGDVSAGLPRQHARALTPQMLRDYIGWVGRGGGWGDLYREEMARYQADPEAYWAWPQPGATGDTAQNLMDISMDLVNPMQKVAGLVGATRPIDRAIRFLGRYGEDIDPRALSATEKSNLTRYGRALEVPAVRRREQLRKTSEEEIVEDVPAPREPMTPEMLEGKVLVPLVGDVSRTGAVVSNVGGVPLSESVLVQGGPGFARERSGTGIGWASNLSAAQSKQANITKAAEQTGLDPIMVYSAMSPTSINFSTPPTEMALAQMDTLKIPKKEQQAFSAAVRRTPGGKAKRFVGIEHPDAYQQLMGLGKYPVEGSGDLRKAFIEEMSKARWWSKGFPDYEDIRRAVTDPALLSHEFGDVGGAFIRGVPGASLAENPFHRSYTHGIRGAYLGEASRPISPDIAFPDVMATLSRQVNVAGQPLTRSQQLGSLRSAHHYQPVTQQVLDLLGPRLEALRP